MRIRPITTAIPKGVVKNLVVIALVRSSISVSIEMLLINIKPQRNSTEFKTGCPDFGINLLLRE
jgi:hypothetical protein